MLFSVHTQEVQRVNMDEDPPMDGVCEEAETGGDTLGFPFSLSLSLSNFFEKIRVFSLFQTSSAS
jgi:hypothetical protein